MDPMTEMNYACQRTPCLCPNYFFLIMFHYCTICLVCPDLCTEEENACLYSNSPPTPYLFFFFPSRCLLPSLHVGSSLRLHFSCLGSLLSSPANKSSTNLLPESLPLLQPSVARQHNRGGGAVRGGRVEELASKSPGAVQKQQASFCQKVFQGIGSFPLIFPLLFSFLLLLLTVHYYEAKVHI